MRKTNKFIKILAYFIYAVSFLWVFKKLTKWIFDRRKKKAIQKANKRHKEEKKKIFVIQIGKKFHVGTREELRRENKTGRKAVKYLSKTHWLDYNYKNAIIYEAK